MVYGDEKKRYTPGDFLLKSNLRSKLIEYGMGYDEFIRELSQDVEVKEYVD